MVAHTFRDCGNGETTRRQRPDQYLCGLAGAVLCVWLVLMAPAVAAQASDTAPSGSPVPVQQPSANGALTNDPQAAQLRQRQDPPPPPPPPSAPNPVGQAAQPAAATASAAPSPAAPAQGSEANTVTDGDPAQAFDSPVASDTEAATSEHGGFLPSVAPPAIIDGTGIGDPNQPSIWADLSWLHGFLLLGGLVSGGLIVWSLMRRGEYQRKIKQFRENGRRAAGELQLIFKSIRDVHASVKGQSSDRASSSRLETLKGALENLRTLAMKQQTLDLMEKSQAGLLSADQQGDIQLERRNIDHITKQLEAQIHGLLAGNSDEIEALAIQIKKMLRLHESTSTIEVYRVLLDKFHEKSRLAESQFRSGRRDDPVGAPAIEEPSSGPRRNAGASKTVLSPHTPDVEEKSRSFRQAEDWALRDASEPASEQDSQTPLEGEAIEALLIPLFAALPPVGGRRREGDVVSAVQAALSAPEPDRKRLVAEALAYEFYNSMLVGPDREPPAYEVLLKDILARLDIGLELVPARIGDYANGYEVTVRPGLMSGPNQLSRLAIADRTTGDILAKGHVAAV